MQTLFTEQTKNLPIRCKQKCLLKTINIGRYPLSINYENLTSQSQKNIRTNQSSIVIPGRCEKLGVEVVVATAVVVVAAGVVAVAGPT